MDAGKHRARGYTMSSNKRLSYLLLLLVALGAAMLSVGILHKMRERRVFSILLQERDQQLMSLQVLLEKEKEISKEMRRKVDELQAKTSILNIERTELKHKVMDSETTKTHLTNTQKELEAALVEKESHINQMKEIAAASGPDQMAAIKELLQQKEAELEEIKTKFQNYKKPDMEVSDSIVLGRNNENATSDTAVLENSANSGDFIPAPIEKHNSYNTTASESNHQDERIVVGINNEDVTPDTVKLEEKANSSDSIHAPAEEELHSYNTTTSETNHREDSSSEEQFIKFTTNFEDDRLQEKTGDANQDSDEAPEGSHSEKSELHQLADSQEVNKEEPDGTRQLEDPQGGVSYRSRESKLLEKEVDKEVVREPSNEINPEGELKISKDSSSEANQEIMQAVEPVANPADVKSSMSANNDETKETSKRHRKRRSRSKRRKRADVATSNVDGEVTRGR